jgi:acetoin utilization protein AcuB
MLVHERMTRHPITIGPDTPVTDALDLMRQNRVRRLPVLDKKGGLAGIISEKDVLYASPSPATSLSVFEISYLLTKLTVKEVMTREVITVCHDCPLEEAARTMVDHRVGGLPVMHEDEMVGIITETDLFKVFLEMLGAREQGLRVSLSVANQPGTLAAVASAVTKLGGDIVSLGTFYGEDRAHSSIAMKVRGVEEKALRENLEKAGAQVLDLREN